MAMDSSWNRGFSLLELLVVLVIIGLLAGVVAPSLFKNVGSSELTTARAQVDALGKAIDQYSLDNRAWPTTHQGLAALMQRPAEALNWKGPYLRKSVPLDPWGQPYQYRTPGEHNADYDLYSFGPDKVPGGEGDNADIGNW
jgi:general secretion pathway protein G